MHLIAKDIVHSAKQIAATWTHANQKTHPHTYAYKAEYIIKEQQWGVMRWDNDQHAKCKQDNPAVTPEALPPT